MHQQNVCVVNKICNIKYLLCTYSVTKTNNSAMTFENKIISYDIFYIANE